MNIYSQEKKKRGWLPSFLRLTMTTQEREKIDIKMWVEHAVSGVVTPAGRNGSYRQKEAICAAISHRFAHAAPWLICLIYSAPYSPVFGDILRVMMFTISVIFLTFQKPKNNNTSSEKKKKRSTGFDYERGKKNMCLFFFFQYNGMPSIDCGDCLVELFVPVIRFPPEAGGTAVGVTIYWNRFLSLFFFWSLLPLLLLLWSLLLPLLSLKKNRTPNRFLFLIFSIYFYFWRISIRKRDWRWRSVYKNTTFKTIWLECQQPDPPVFSFFVGSR